jgi:hypothetical protein
VANKITLEEHVKTLIKKHLTKFELNSKFYFLSPNEVNTEVLDFDSIDDTTEQARISEEIKKQF